MANIWVSVITVPVRRAAYPLNVNNLPDEQARAILELEDRFGDALQVVVLPAEGDGTADAPGLRYAVGDT